MNDRNKNRIQIYLNETYHHVLDEIKQLKQFDSTMDERELIKYIVLDYHQLLTSAERLKDKLTYIDQNISILLNLQSSMAMEYHIPSYPLKDSLPYFQAKKQVESMMNLPRSILPSPAIQKELQEPTKRWDEKAFTEKPKTSSVSIPKSKPVKNQRDETEEMPNYFL